MMDRCCKAAPTLDDPFLTAFLRAFKHTLTGDLRLVTSSTDEHGIRSVETHRGEFAAGPNGLRDFY